MMRRINHPLAVTSIKGFCSVFLLNTAGVAALEFSWKDQLESSFILESDISTSIDNADLQKFQFTLTADGKLSLTESMRLTGIARFRYDTIDELEPGQPKQLERDTVSRRALMGDDVEAELREFYLDAYVGDTFIRLGKQQVVWGQADGIRVLDLVNPHTFREFILEDFENSRIPLWTVAVEVPVGEGLIQLLWIPDQTYDELPSQNAAYALTSPRLVPPIQLGIPITISDPQRPDNTFSDSDAGARFSIFAGGWDLTANYLYHYYDQPVISRQMSSNGLVLTPQYQRTHTFGGTASNAFGNFTFRSEIAYSSDRVFIDYDPLQEKGVSKTGELNYVLGIDWRGPSDTLVSAQYFESRLRKSRRQLSRRKADRMATLLLERGYQQQTVTASVFLLHGFHDKDGLVQPKLTYKVYDNLTLKLSMDIFYGRTQGFFGQFDKTDRITAGFELGF